MERESGRAPSLGGHIGDIKSSMLGEGQLKALPDGADWVLADGRNVAGSKYTAITGQNTVPDLRGVFLRGKNFTRERATGNADGDLALGTFQANQNAAHAHGYTRMIHNNNADGVDSVTTHSFEHRLGPDTTESSGGNESRPNSVTVNYFIKIN
jgi:hypothetical protein